MIIKQPNGKYCEIDFKDELVFFNYTEQDVINMYINKAQNDMGNARHFGEIIKANEKHPISDEDLKLMGFDKPYEELVKFIPRKPLNTSYAGCDFTTYGKCPSCGEVVYNGMGGIIEKCSCGQLLEWRGVVWCSRK